MADTSVHKSQAEGHRAKARGMNLIRKEVQLRTHVRYEKDWYILINLLIISVVAAFSILSFLFQLNMKSQIANKTATLAQKINTDLNTNSKSIIRARINSFEDKYKIYNDFQTQNFDVNKFYTEVMGIYPGIKITKFIVQPDSTTIDINLVLEKDGYNKLPEFLNAIEKSPRFKYSIIKSVTFSLKEQVLNTKGNKTLVDEVRNSSDYNTDISLIVDKYAPNPDLIEEGN